MQPDTEASTSVTLRAGVATQMLLFWRKGITENLSIKARDQSLGRVFPLKQGGEPSVYTPPPLQCGPCIIAWTMEEIPSKPLRVACDGRTAAFSPTLNDYSSHFFLYRILWRGIELLREKPWPVYSGGPFTADKN